jgi:hypothetical protein
VKLIYFFIFQNLSHGIFFCSKILNANKNAEFFLIFVTTYVFETIKNIFGIFFLFKIFEQEKNAETKMKKWKIFFSNKIFSTKIKPAPLWSDLFF